MKKTLALLLIVAVAAMVATTAFAGDKPDAKKAKQLDPKKLFRENCKICHGEDSPAGEYSPMFLIQDQWKQFFDEDYVETHKDVPWSESDTTKVVDKITPEELKAIRDFCIDGAADSEHPMTCG
jgi:mono/diheme cytochrome c family protein